MSRKKTHKKNRLIAKLAVLLVITGAGSAVVISNYFQKQPAAEAPTQVKTANSAYKAPADDAPAEEQPAESVAEDTVAEDTSSANAVIVIKDDSEAVPVDKPKAQENKTASSKKNLSDDEQINTLMEGMTLHEKVCQLFIVTPESLTGYDLVTQSGAATLDSLAEYPVGGLIYFAQNLESTEQTADMISATQNSNSTISDIPLFISVDEEGGIVARCAEKLGTTEFEPMYTYRTKGTDTAYENAFTIAEDIAELGFNLDFAPVADTWSNPVNTVIGTRAYSDDFEETAELVASAVEGFHAGGVACTIKHFPGHGDTAEDSHEGMACSYKTIEELEKGEYLAFESGIAAGADMVMVGHITMVNVDNMPASLSPTFMKDELRTKLGFDGLIITDALGMGALANYYSSDEVALAVVKAGGDILLMPEDLQASVAAIEQAVEAGDITEERINESVERILKLKKEKGML